MRFLIPEFKDIVNHLCFAFLKHTLLLSLINHRDYLFLSDILKILMRIDTDKPQHKIRKLRHHKSYRCENIDKQSCRLDQPIECFLRKFHSDTLRNKYPDNKQENNDNNRNCKYYPHGLNLCRLLYSP